MPLALVTARARTRGKSPVEFNYQDRFIKSYCHECHKYIYDDM